MRWKALSINICAPQSSSSLSTCVKVNEEIHPPIWEHLSVPSTVFSLLLCCPWLYLWLLGKLRSGCWMHHDWMRNHSPCSAFCSPDPSLAVASFTLLPRLQVAADGLKWPHPCNTLLPSLDLPISISSRLPSHVLLHVVFVFPRTLQMVLIHPRRPCWAAIATRVFPVLLGARGHQLCLGDLCDPVYQVHESTELTNVKCLCLGTSGCKIRTVIP